MVISLLPVLEALMTYFYVAECSVGVAIIFWLLHDLLGPTL